MCYKVLKIKNISFWIVVLLRVFMPLIIIFNYWWGWLLNGLIDLVDGQVWPRAVKLDSLQYHFLDKVFDTWMYLVMLFVSFRYDFFWLLFVLFIYRMLGQFIFWMTKKENMFIYFPNLFEVFWLWYLVLTPLDLPSGTKFLQGYFGLFLLCILKMLQEFVIHDFGRETVFPWFRRKFSSIVAWEDKVFIPK